MPTFTFSYGVTGVVKSLVGLTCPRNRVREDAGGQETWIWQSIRALPPGLLLLLAEPVALAHVRLHSGEAGFEK